MSPEGLRRARERAAGRPRRREAQLLWLAIGGVTGIALLAWLGLGGSSSTPTQPVPGVPTTTVSTTATAPRPAVDLVFTGRGNRGSYLEVRNGSETGATVYSGVLVPGASRTFSFAEAAWVRIGTPSAIAITVGGEPLEITGGTGTFHLHDRVTEVQAGSYALMDTYYARFGHPFEQAVHVYGTVVSATSKYAVADVGLKSMGMDHGNPSLETLDGNGADVWFLSDEHVTFVPHTGVASVGDRVRLPPAHIDPTMAMHEVAWLARGHEVIDRWPIDLRNW
jgi:hypothetical protein